MPFTDPNVPDFTTRHIAAALGISRQAITDLLRRSDRQEQQPRTWNRFDLAQAVEVGMVHELTRASLTPRLARNLMRQCADMISLEVREVLGTIQDKRDWRAAYEAAPVSIAVRVTGQAEGNEGIMAMRVEGPKPDLSDFAGSAVTLLVPLSAVIIKFADWLAGTYAAQGD